MALTVNLSAVSSSATAKRQEEREGEDSGAESL